MAKRKARSQTGLKPAQLISLAVLVGLLLLLAIFFFVDAAARQQAAASYRQLEDRFQQAEKAADNTPVDLLNPERVRQIVNKAPDGPPEQRGEYYHQSFSWSGILRKYTIYVEYEKGADYLVHKISLNQPIIATPASN